jgi:hypothetical protein
MTTSTIPSNEPDRLAEIEAKRAARREAIEVQRREQLATDLEHLFELEEQHGASRLVRVDLKAFTPGLPALIVMRTPSKLEMKRYQDQCKGKGDPVAAANLVGTTCLLYPSKDVYEKVLEASPGIHVVAAVAAIERAAGKAVEEGKS